MKRMMQQMEKEDQKKEEEEKKKKEEEKSKKKERGAPDFTLELVTSDATTASAPVSKFMVIPPPFKEQFTKLAILDEKGYEKDWEPVFQTVRIPFASFVTGDGAKEFEPGKLTAVRLKFDRTEMSVICVSGIGFGKR